MKQYTIVLAPRAVKQLAALPREAQELIRIKLDRLENGLAGEIKRLKSFTPAYRLRVGDYRVLFDVEGSRVVVGLIGHRRDVYER